MASIEPRDLTDIPGRKALPPFAALRAFDAVAKLGGVRRAAQLLAVDHAVVSRHLRTLEAWTSSTLINRSRNGSLLTEDGERYHREITLAIDGIARATTDLLRRADDHSLQIWCMPGFAYQWLASRLESFQSAYKMLQVDIRPTDMAPDFSRHQADVDIRYLAIYAPPEAVPSYVRTVEIARPPVLPVASPDYIAATPPVSCVADLLGHLKLHEENFDNWRAWFQAHGFAPDEEVLSGPRLWHAHLTVDTARRGRGVALANHFLAVDDLAAGRLVEIGKGLAGFEPMSLGSYHFAARADRWTAAPVVRFRRWLLDTIKAEFGAQ